MQSYPATYIENAHDDAHLAHTTISTPNDSPPQETFSYDGHGCVASIHTFGASPSSTFSSALGSPFDDHTLRLAEPSSSATNTPQLPSHQFRLAPSNSFLDMHPSPSTQVTSLPPASHDSREVQPPSLLEEVSAALLRQLFLLTPKSVPISDRRSTEVYVAAPSTQKRIILIRLSSPQPWSTFRKLALTLPKTANTGRRNTDSFNKSSKIATRTLCSEMHNARGYSIQLTRCRESKDLLHRHLGTFRPPVAEVPSSSAPKRPAHVRSKTSTSPATFHRNLQSFNAPVDALPKTLASLQLRNTPSFLPSSFSARSFLSSANRLNQQQFLPLASQSYPISSHLDYPSFRHPFAHEQLRNSFPRPARSSSQTTEQLQHPPFAFSSAYPMPPNSRSRSEGTLGLWNVDEVSESSSHPYSNRPEPLY